VVRSAASSGHDGVYKGICLELPRLAGRRAGDTVHCHGARKPVAGFPGLPDDPWMPSIIMIGPGTGLAPFHAASCRMRAARKAKGTSLEVRRCWFFCCRHPEQ